MVKCVRVWDLTQLLLVKPHLWNHIANVFDVSPVSDFTWWFDAFTNRMTDPWNSCICMRALYAFRNQNKDVWNRSSLARLVWSYSTPGYGTIYTAANQSPLICNHQCFQLNSSSTSVYLNSYPASCLCSLLLLWRHPWNGLVSCLPKIICTKGRRVVNFLSIDDRTHIFIVSRFRYQQTSILRRSNSDSIEIQLLYHMQDTGNHWFTNNTSHAVLQNK